jgi:hypothetical protein
VIKKRRKLGAVSDGDKNAGMSTEVESTADMDYDDGSASVERSIVPMPAPGSITALREKLHERMAALRKAREGGPRNVYRGDPNDRNNMGDAFDKDKLLEERRQERVANKEMRRKEVKEKRKSKEGDKRAQTTVFPCFFFAN